MSSRVRLAEAPALKAVKRGEKVLHTVQGKTAQQWAVLAHERWMASQTTRENAARLRSEAKRMTRQAQKAELAVMEAEAIANALSELDEEQEGGAQ